MQRIIVGYDGSPNAERAVAFAADMASRYQAELLVVHVMAATSGYGSLESMPEQALIAEMYEREHDMLATAAERLLQQAVDIAERHGDPQMRTLKMTGSPATQLVRCAEAHDADAIVVGSRGLGEVAGLLLGSVSNRVAHVADCVVVTVK